MRTWWPCSSEVLSLQGVQNVLQVQHVIMNNQVQNSCAGCEVWLLARALLTHSCRSIVDYEIPHNERLWWIGGLRLNAHGHSSGSGHYMHGVIQLHFQTSTYLRSSDCQWCHSRLTVQECSDGCRTSLSSLVAVLHITAMKTLLPLFQANSSTLDCNQKKPSFSYNVASQGRTCKVALTALNLHP